jgi:adenine-specific DNA-methyltransferase
MNLNDTDKNRIIELIKAGEKLPKEYIYKLFADEEDVFLFWNGRKEDVTNIALPFHSIEHIDEPRKEEKKAGDMFEMFDTRGRQLKGWTNKLIWGDNKLILSSLANGPIRDEIEKEGGLKLIYIDPPFAVGADFGFEIEIGGEKAEKKQSIIEEIAYRDTWGKGISSYLSMMYERLKLMHNLLAEDGSLYLHCDWRVVNHLRLLMDEIFGSEKFRNSKLSGNYSGWNNQSLKHRF